MCSKPLSCTIACTVFPLVKCLLAPRLQLTLHVDSSVSKLLMKHLSIFLRKML